MDIVLDTRNLGDYRRFLAIKKLPRYTIAGCQMSFPDEYAHLVGMADSVPDVVQYQPLAGLFDYQKDIARTALTKRKYCVFADCGLGKTLILLEFARHVMETRKRPRVLIVSPLMVVKQTMAEAKRFYGDRLPISQIPASKLAAWLADDSCSIGITNYDAIHDELPNGRLDALILDESSMLKHHYGAWGTKLIDMGRGVPFKLCLTGTPAPNDRIEFANHAVFMDAFPTVNSFLARFFINRGQTAERWELKQHALQGFYVALSHWCIFLTNPATYGWKDNCGTLPPINIHVDDIPLTHQQRTAFQDGHGALLMTDAGGIGERSKIARIGKGFANGKRIESNKTKYIVDLIASWPKESTLVWCKYNQEQDDLAASIPGAASIDGATPIAERERIVDAFKAGTIRTLITKPKILGFGLNLQIATRHVFSGLQDSYEEFYQAVKRSNRYGSTLPLNVHIPVTELEKPMIETVLSKANRVNTDTIEQERIFKQLAGIA